MMLLPGFAAIAILLTAQDAAPRPNGDVTDPAVSTLTSGPAAEIDPNVQGEGGGTAAPERERVVCETRAPTGSRLNQRRCRTRSVTATQGRLARDAVDALQPGPSTDAILNSPTYTPQ